MDLVFIIILLITGIFIGLATGFLGVGGCFIMVPVMFWILTSMGFTDKIPILVAFGTNLMVVVPTALSGAYRHWKKDAVLLKSAITMGVCGAISAFFGAFTATQLPGNILKVVFGILILASAVRMLLAKTSADEQSPPENATPYILVGFAVGFFTGLLGIGGGVLMVPALAILLHFDMHKAVGTSTALMFFTASAGALSYMVLGLGTAGLPDISIGYVNLLMFLALAATSVPVAQLGARVAHLVPAKQLRYVFIVVMIYAGLKMVGLFEWLGLPL